MRRCRWSTVPEGRRAGQRREGEAARRPIDRRAPPPIAAPRSRCWYPVSMRLHCTALAIALCLGGAGLVRAQTVDPAPGSASFLVYLRGTQIGREQVSLARSDSGWIITSRGHNDPPIDVTINRFEMKYGGDWQPLEMTLELRSSRAAVLIRTSFNLTTAVNEITQGNSTGSRQDQISARTIVMPTNVFGAAEA